MEEPLRVPLDDLETSPENPWYDAVYQGRPFTGIAWDEWNGRYSETAYVDGVAHGRSFERFESGLLASDELVDHGQLTEGTFWWPPGETVRRRKTAEADRWYDQRGALYEEKTAEHLRRFYPSGAMQEETLYGPEEAALTCRAPDGTWTVRGRFPYVFEQSYALERERMRFHDEYIQSHAAELLETEPTLWFWKYFILWLPKLPEKKGLFRKSPQTPPHVRQVTCDLILSENLHVKYHGINLAKRYHVTEAVPLLRQALSIQVNPGHYGTPKDGITASYGETVAQRAQAALRSLEERRG